MNDFHLFVAICGVLDACEQTKQKISLRGVYRRITGKGWKISLPTLSNCLDRMEDFWQVPNGSLILRPKGGDCQFGPGARRAFETALGVAQCITDARHDSAVTNRASIRLATHSVYEQNALPVALPRFLDQLARTVRQVDFQLVEIRDIHEGILRLRDGSVSLVLDAVAVPPLDENVEAIDLHVEWERVVLFPKNPHPTLAKAMGELLDKKDWLTLDDLTTVPLCFVEFADVIESELLRRSSAQRIGLGTVEGVRRLVQTGRFAGLAINWIRALGPDYEKQFDVRFLRTSRPRLHMRLWHRSNWDASGPLGMLAEQFESFFRSELGGKGRAAASKTNVLHPKDVYGVGAK